MAIQLTEEQQQAIDAAGAIPPQVVDPRTSAAYVLIPAEDYETGPRGSRRGAAAESHPGGGHTYNRGRGVEKGDAALKRAEQAQTD